MCIRDRPIVLYFIILQIGGIEAALSCVGAEPKALVNCLNFGNPENPTVMWQLSEAVDGMAEACIELDLPVVGGNVSLYNESQGVNIDPTVMASDFEGSYVYSVGIWKVQPGKALDLIQRFQTAEKILEEAGARVEIYQGGWGSIDEFHYVLMYENWASLNESFPKMGPGSDWSEYMAESAQQDIIATQTSYFTAQTIGQ